MKTRNRAIVDAGAGALMFICGAMYMQNVDGDGIRNAWVAIASICGLLLFI